MKEKKFDHQTMAEGSTSNIIFGTSSDDIQQGLHNNQFIDANEAFMDGDKDQIVNEEEQNEIVNPSEETFNEEPAPQPVSNDAIAIEEVKTQQERNPPDLDPQKAIEAEKSSEAED